MRLSHAALQDQNRPQDYVKRATLGNAVLKTLEIGIPYISVGVTTDRSVRPIRSEPVQIGVIIG